ncbi:hypothetical protein H4582DRAFT_2063291 [Lactarius indigo]|nr:hypothetical protein H4582DRAFT_2063291 [Lactarius indigo]
MGVRGVSNWCATQSARAPLQDARCDRYGARPPHRIIQYVRSSLGSTKAWSGLQQLPTSGCAGNASLTRGGAVSQRDLVPVPLAAAHQSGSFALLSAVLHVLLVLRRPDAVAQIGRGLLHRSIVIYFTTTHWHAAADYTSVKYTTTD